MSTLPVFLWYCCARSASAYRRWATNWKLISQLESAQQKGSEKSYLCICLFLEQSKHSQVCHPWPQGQDMYTAPGTICNAKPKKASFYLKVKSGIFTGCLSFAVNCWKLSHVVNWFSTEYNHNQHLGKMSILSFLNLDSCDEKYHTPNSLGSCECGLGDSKFLLKYHLSFPGVHDCCALLSCQAEVEQRIISWGNIPTLAENLGEKQGTSQTCYGLEWMVSLWFILAITQPFLTGILAQLC